MLLITQCCTVLLQFSFHVWSFTLWVWFLFCRLKEETFCLVWHVMMITAYSASDYSSPLRCDIFNNPNQSQVSFKQNRTSLDLCLALVALLANWNHFAIAWVIMDRWLLVLSDTFNIKAYCIKIMKIVVIWIYSRTKLATRIHTKLFAQFFDISDTLF